MGDSPLGKEGTARQLLLIIGLNQKAINLPASGRQQHRPRVSWLQGQRGLASVGWQDVASSAWLGATTSSQAEDTLTAKPLASHHIHHCVRGQATSLPVAGALFPSLLGWCKS